MNKKEDLRIIKTKKVLFNTLVDLMKEKTFEEIKVADICSKALINRSTFYSHYSDKYDLLMDYMENLKLELLESLEDNNHIVNTKEYYLELIKIILDHLEDKKDIYYTIITNNRNSIIMDIIIDVTVKDINKKLKINNFNNFNIPTEIFTEFYLGGVASICLAWLKSDNKYTKQDIIDYIEKLIP